jgi:nucleotide-binding universal stress UspA family protein
MNSIETYCEQSENIQHVLVPLDASDSSHRVIQYLAKFLSNNSEVFITLLHMSTPEEWQNKETGEELVKEKVRSEMELELIQDRKTLIDAGLKAEQVRTRLVERTDGSITDGILAQQRELKACTIVVGRNHRSKRAEMLFGSIANRLAHKAEHCAVWIVE